MDRIISPPAIVRADAEDLALLASRVREREAGNRATQLEHVKKQAADVWAAREQCRRRPPGAWGQWCKDARLSERTARKYAALYEKAAVTAGFSSLPEGQQWAEWQRIQGNTRPDEEEDEQEGPAPESAENEAPPDDDADSHETPAPDEEEEEDAEEIANEEEQEDPRNRRTAFLNRVDIAMRCAQDSGWVTRQSVGYARRVADVWSKLADKMESKL